MIYMDTVYMMIYQSIQYQLCTRQNKDRNIDKTELTSRNIVPLTLHLAVKDIQFI